MKEIDKYSKEIEEYVQNKMSNEDRLDFEKIIKKNDKIKDEINLLLSLKKKYRDSKELVILRKKLDGYSSYSEGIVQNESNNNSRLLFQKVIFIAAILVLGYGLYFFVEDNHAQSSFYAEIITPLGQDKNEIITLHNARSNWRGSSLTNDIDISDSLFLDIFSYFEEAAKDQKKLDKFINHCKLLLQKKQYSEDYRTPTQIFLSRAYLLDNNPKKAVFQLEEIEINSKSKCLINYYKAIAYATQNKNDEALGVLDLHSCDEIAIELEVLREKILKNN